MCFGKVVKGFDVVDKIAERITRASLPEESKEGGDVALDDSLLVHPVKIVAVSIVNEPGANGGAKEDDPKDEL